jgi:hypothetical protein
VLVLIISRLQVSDKFHDTIITVFFLSWGEYWGEMGYVRVLMGHNALVRFDSDRGIRTRGSKPGSPHIVFLSFIYSFPQGIESTVAWATPAAFTVENFPCDEDGGNCQDGPSVRTQHYLDPSKKREALGSVMMGR